MTAGLGDVPCTQLIYLASVCKEKQQMMSCGGIYACNKVIFPCSEAHNSPSAAFLNFILIHRSSFDIPVMGKSDYYVGVVN